MTRRISIVAFALVVLSQGGCAQYTVVQVQPGLPPPTLEQVEGTWYRVSTFSAHRLDLSNDGTGTLVSAYAPQKELRQYTTDRWHLQDHDLTATFHPVDSDTDPVYLRARADRLYYSQAHLRNVSLSLSECGSYVIGDFIRDSLLNEWLDVLVEPMEPR